MSRCPLVLLALFTPFLCGFQVVSDAKIPAPSQPLDERAAQAKLPQAQDPFWGELAKCHVGMDKKTQLYTINVAPDVKALDGKTVQASGFVLPMDGSDKTKYFLLTKRTPVCFFCPPGEPNEVIAVRSKHAVDWNDDMVRVSGRFALVNDGEKGIFFELRDAEPVKK